MAFPSQAVIEGWNSDEAGSGTVGAVLDWANASDELRAAVLVQLECDHNERYRSVSMLSEAEMEEVVTEATIDGRALSRMNKSKVRMFFQAVRTAAGTLPRDAAPGTPPAPVVIATPTELTSASSNAVALNGVISQVGSAVVPLATNDLVKTVHTTYQKKTGGPMAQDAEPTRF